MHRNVTSALYAREILSPPNVSAFWAYTVRGCTHRHRADVLPFHPYSRYLYSSLVPCCHFILRFRSLFLPELERNRSLTAELLSNVVSSAWARRVRPPRRRLDIVRPISKGETCEASTLQRPLLVNC